MKATVVLVAFFLSVSASPLAEDERIFGLFAKETTTAPPGIIDGILGGLFGGRDTTTTPVVTTKEPSQGLLQALWNLLFPKATTTTTTTTTTPPPTTTKCGGLFG